MHSLIVDDPLAADLDSLCASAEVRDEDGYLLGVFVPAPGGAPGPEWADEDDTRTWVVVTATFREKVCRVSDELKFRGPNGRLLGWFVPAAPAEEKHLVSTGRGQ